MGEPLEEALAAGRIDALLVIGAPNSSNSLRLREVAERCGTPARLIQRASEIQPEWLDGVGSLGLTAAQARLLLSLEREAGQNQAHYAELLEDDDH